MNPIEYLAKMKESKRAVGFDISKWNVSFDLDEPQGISVEDVDEIVDFVALRASVCYTSGGIDTDPKFMMFYEELEQHPNKVRIAYPFLNKSRDWIPQYDKFLEAIDGKEFEILAPDSEHHASINNLSSRSSAEYFAGITRTFTTQLRKDFPNKWIMLYTNPATFNMLRPYYPSFFDNVDLWIAQWPYYDWLNMPETWIPGFLAWIEEVFTGEPQPKMPVSRSQNSWEVWQVAAQTYIGEELGFGADYLDTNISRRLLEDFRERAKLYDRWKPETPPDDIPDDAVSRMWKALKQNTNWLD
jgi:hypothetical protein